MIRSVLPTASTTAFALLGFVLPARSQAQQLIVNGDFETGTFAGFTLANQLNPDDTANADHFYISAPGSNTPPVDGFTFATAANPAGGNFYAVTASDFPGAHALLQDFTVPANTKSLALSFQMFVNDQSGIGPIIDPSGLDYTTGGLAQPNGNQHARVDILRAGATDLSTAAADVVDDLYLNVDPGTLDINGNLIPNPYLTYTANLTEALAPGASYRLRFAEVDNQSSINLGVDNISLIATPTPEPGSFTLFVGIGVTGILLASRRGHAHRLGW
jgi:hypothetical protein